MYVFDTNILVDFLRGRLPLGLELLKNTDSRLIKIPAVVVAELLVGAYKNKNPEKLREAIESLLVNFEILPFDERCAIKYAQIRAELELAGNRIESNDMMIAATTIVHDAILATNDLNDFGRIPELRIMSLAEVEH
ncbi:MAG: type II toxin-antitoxin system VapC family toxin [Coriobacteriales bacterium]|nr:type II toxin-antitoxin system VapC family toxin [Coriobacteriales bacterium]